MLIIYHIADHDGKGSAAIVKNLYPEAEVLGFNHDMDIPREKIAQHEKIVVVDIALPLEYMFELSKTKEITWIDHHISVINEYEDKMATGNYPPLKGLRRNGTAAIELTWEYYHPDEPIPDGIKLLALNDLFDLKDERVRPFEYAMQSCGVNRPEDEIWTHLINDKIDIDGMVEKGEAILSWIKVRNYRLVKTMAFASELKGFKCICANMPQGYSEFFDSVENLEDYDIMVNFYMDKKNYWKMTFYTTKDNVDVSRIAGSFGGGGHRRAAGATVKKLPDFLSKK